MSLNVYPHLFPQRSISTPDLDSVASGDHDVALADRVANVDAAAWDRLVAPAGGFLQRSYLRLLEDARPENLTPRYAVISHRRRPVAAVAAQKVDVGVGAVRARLLVCGNALSWGPHGVAFAAGSTCWPEVVDALERIDAEDARRRADAIVIKDYPASAQPPPGFRRLATEPDMVLELPDAWRTFDDYLASLKGRYRRAALKVARQVAAAGCRLERPRDLAPVAGRLHDLYLQVEAAARWRLAQAPAAYLPSLAALRGDDLRCTLIRHGGLVVGFVTTLRDGATALGYHLGFDRELGARVPLYLRLLHATVADALALGCRRLSLGRTALESKARLGARPRPLCAWVRSRWPVGWLEQVARPAEAPVRRPFGTLA